VTDDADDSTTPSMPRDAAVLDSRSYGRLLGDPRLLAVVLLSVAGTLGTNVAAPALPAMGAGLGVADARLGLVITVYTLPAMVAVPVAGVLADLYGRRTVVIPSLAAFGVFGASVALVSTFEAVLVLRALQGTAFAGVMPLSVTIIGDLYDGERGSTAQGIRVSVNGVSSIVVPAVAGALSAVAWHYPFLIYAAALPVVVVVYLVLPETAGEVPTRAGFVAQLRAYVRSIRAELGRPRVATLVAGGGVRDFVRYAIVTFIPLFAVRSLDASFAQAGAVLSLRGAASIVVSPLAGRIVAGVTRRWALAGSLVLGAACLVAVPFAPDVVWLGAVVFGYSVGDAVFSPVLKSSVTDAAPDGSRAGVISGLNVLKFAAQASSPAFFGLVLTLAGFATVFWLGAAIAMAYAAVVAVLLR
jgi:MFS family permease